MYGIDFIYNLIIISIKSTILYIDITFINYIIYYLSLSLLLLFF